MVCTGAKSEAEVQKAVKSIVKLLKAHGIDIKNEPVIEVQNIVASANLRGTVDLERAAFLLENSMYEPEQFPGLIYRMQDPKVVLLIFSSGKVVCTGAKKEEEVKRAVDNIHRTLREQGILLEEA